LIVFAAAGGKPAVEEVSHRFEKKYGVTVGTSYGGGGEILSRMILAHRGDIYIAPEQRFMKKARDEQAIDATTVKTLAYMVPVIAVKRGNPKTILSLADLAKRGIRLAITRPETTLLGQYAPQIFQEAGLEAAIMRNVVTHAADPNHLLSLLIMDQIDAGIVWHFYGTMALESIETISLSPEQSIGIGKMEIAVTTYSKRKKLAQQFVDFATSSEGKAVFKKCGYIVEVKELKR
jgi:molybdate transport system substrate-binding protein